MSKKITDKQLLDFLETFGDASNLRWVLSHDKHGRGWDLHQDRIVGEHDTVREAITAAMQRHLPEESK